MLYSVMKLSISKKKKKLDYFFPSPWVVWVLWHINLWRLFNAKSIVKHSLIVKKHFYFKLFSLVKQFSLA